MNRWLLFVTLAVISTLSFAEQPEIRIDGISGPELDNVRAHLSLTPEPCDAPRWRIERLSKQAKREIRRALRAMGYYRAVVASQPAEFSETCWSVHFTVAPGEPVRVKTVELLIDGAAGEDSAFQALRADLPLKAGDILNHDQYESAKRSITTLAAERGYFEGRFSETTLRVDPSINQAVVRVRYESGPRYRLGELRLKQDYIDADMARRLVSYAEGKPYESRHLATLHRELVDSGYFAAVEVRQRMDESEDHAIPIDVELTPKKRHSFSFGPGFATDTGPRVKLGYAHRRLNRRGHRLSSALSVSPVKSSIDADYEIPLADPRSEWLSLQAGYQLEDTDTSESQIFKLGARVTRRRPADWLETRFVEFVQEDSTIADEDVNSTMVVPGIGWSRTRADNKIYPRKGHRLGLEFRGSHDAIGSDTPFFQVRANAKWIRGLPWNGRLIARGQLGLTAVDNFDGLPASQRFFAGGDQSVRGYDYQSLGPEDSSGEVIGGRNLLVGSIEYEHPVRKNWSVAAFVDTGNALDGFGDDLNTGVGLGVRWRSPIGPIRVDLASPLDDPDNSVRVHFTMGPDL